MVLQYYQLVCNTVKDCTILPSLIPRPCGKLENWPGNETRMYHL